MHQITAQEAALYSAQANTERSQLLVIRTTQQEIQVRFCEDGTLNVKCEEILSIGTFGKPLLLCCEGTSRGG